MISSSIATMNKFQLRLNDSTADDQNPRRKFSSMTAIASDLRRPERVHEVINYYGAHFQELSLYSFMFTWESLTKMLQNLPLLKCLELTMIELKDSPKAPVARLKIPHLKTLKYWDTNSKILELVSASHIKTLEVVKYYTTFDVTNLTSFLQSAKILESLECPPELLKTSFEVSGGVFPFKLKKFFSSDPQDLGEFLLSQSSSLEEIELLCITRADFELIFKKLKRLAILRDVNFEKLPTEEQFYFQLRPTKIKEIHQSRSRRFPNETAVRGILGNCPLLEVLNIPGDNYIPNMLPFLAVNNPRIKHLTLNRLGSGEDHFPALKTLKLLKVDHSERPHLISFLRRNPTVEKLTIDFLTRTDDETGDDDFLSEANFPNIKIRRRN